MQQITVAMLDIDKICSDLSRDRRRRHVGLNQLLNFRVGQNRRIVGHSKFSIQNRMPVGDSWLELLLIIWAAKSPRVCQLESNNKVIRTSMSLLMRFYQCLSKFRNAALVQFADDKLIRICSSVRPYGHGFTTVNQLCPALSKPAPAPDHLICDPTTRRPIPSLHRLNRNSISDPLPVNR